MELQRQQIYCLNQRWSQDLWNHSSRRWVHDTKVSGKQIEDEVVNDNKYSLYSQFPFTQLISQVDMASELSKSMEHSQTEINSEVSQYIIMPN